MPFSKHQTTVKSYVFAFCLVTGVSVFGVETQPPYLDASRPIETRVEDLLSRLTLEEKISIVHADSKFTAAAIPRLGIPRRWMSDGPHGVREDVGPDTWGEAGHTDDFSTATSNGIENQVGETGKTIRVVRCPGAPGRT